jgi:ribose-phosphate pyrophosphokinase
MKNSFRGKIGFMACKSGEAFAKKVISQLKKIVEKEKSECQHSLINTKEVMFANTEVKTEIDESIRNQDIYIFQDVENKTNNMSVNDNLAALKSAIDAAKRVDAHYITVVVPAFPYARQDKQKKREGITASIIARELEDAGAIRILTLDVHNDAIAGFFRSAILENLHASKNIIEHVEKSIGTENLIVVSPDAGGTPRAEHYAKGLHVPMAMLYKKRDYSKANCVSEMELLGDVKDKKVFVIDDMIDTGGTLVRAAQKLKEKGAKEIYFAASLPLLNGPAKERISKAFKEGFITKIIGTDAVFHGDDFVKENNWYEEVSMAEYFAKVIYYINRGKSISELLV